MKKKTESGDPFSLEYIKYALGLYVQQAIDDGWDDHQEFVLEAILQPLHGPTPPRTYTIPYDKRNVWLPRTKANGRD